MHSSGGVVAGGVEHYLEIKRDWSADRFTKTAVCDGGLHD